MTLLAMMSTLAAGPLAAQVVGCDLKLVDLEARAVDRAQDIGRWEEGLDGLEARVIATTDAAFASFRGSAGCDAATIAEVSGFAARIEALGRAPDGANRIARIAGETAGNMACVQALSERVQADIAVAMAQNDVALVQRLAVLAARIRMLDENVLAMEEGRRAAALRHERMAEASRGLPDLCKPLDLDY